MWPTWRLEGTECFTHCIVHCFLLGGALYCTEQWPCETCRKCRTKSYCFSMVLSPSERSSRKRLAEYSSMQSYTGLCNARLVHFFSLFLFPNPGARFAICPRSVSLWCGWSKAAPLLLCFSLLAVFLSAFHPVTQRSHRLWEFPWKPPHIHTSTVSKQWGEMPEQWYFQRLGQKIHQPRRFCATPLLFFTLA